MSTKPTDSSGISFTALYTGAVWHRYGLSDDLLATGGTLNAAIELCQKVGGDVVGTAAIVELAFLGGREKLGVPFEALVSYDD